MIWWRLAKVTHDYNHFIPFPGWPWNEAATSKRPTIQPSAKCAFKRIKFLGAMTVSQVPRVIFRGFAQSSWERLPGWVAVSPSHLHTPKCHLSPGDFCHRKSNASACFNHNELGYASNIFIFFRFSLSKTTQSDKAIPTLDKSNLATALALFTKFFSAKERHARLKCCITLPACQGADANSFHASLVSHKQLLTQDAWTRHPFASSIFCWKLPNIIPNGGETTDHMETLPERQGRPNCHGNPTPLGMLLCRIILAGVSIRSMFGIPGNFKKATLVCLAIRVDIGTVGPAAALTFCKPNH